MNYRNFIRIVLTVLSLIIILALLISVFVPISGFVSKAESHSNLIIAVLTFLLVVITGIYAFLTYKILKQTTAGIRSQIKPSLFIKLGDPEIKSIQMGDSTLKYLFLKKNKIANYGKGAAVNVHISYVCPVRRNEESNEIELSSSSHFYKPISLPANESFEDSLKTQIPDDLERINKNF